MLVTPLGCIDVLIDNVPVLYEALEVSTDKTCRNLDGRFCIKINFVPDGHNHEIACCIKGHCATDKDEIESGECLELKRFYRGKCKLSIGTEGDFGYYDDGFKVVRIGTYDYDSEYVENGVKYIILPETVTSEFVFGIAWIDNADESNSVQTWYGADPTMMHM